MKPATVSEWAASPRGAYGVKDSSLEKPDVEAGFDAVVREYWPRVFRFALASLRDRGEAESLTQDCFLKALQAWSGFRGDSSVGTWLMRIAVNQIRDHGRNRR